MVSKNETISKSSKGLIYKYYDSAKKLDRNNAQFGLMPEFSREKVLEAVRTDGTVIAGITTLVDKSIEYGWKIHGKDGKSKELKFDQSLKDLKFKKLMRQILYNLYTYNNVFIEIVKDGNGKVKELHLLETTQTEPVADKHGKVVGYIQVVPDEDPSGFPSWTPEEVTHIAATRLTTNIWGELDIQSIYTSVLIKQYVYAYLGWLFGTNQFRGFHNIKNASDDQVKQFISYLKRSENDITKPLIAWGDVEYQILRDFKDGDSILSLINKCDDNILTLLQVPPVLMGKPGDSNRSNSDAQTMSLATRVSSIQKLCEDSFENDLFVKMGYKKVVLTFNPINKVGMTRLLENAERMKTMGFKDKKIEEYLKLEGFPIDGSLFEIVHVDKPDEEKSEDMFPSRKRKLPDEMQKKVGSGEEGSTREDQLISKAFTTTFNLHAPLTSKLEEDVRRNDGLTNYYGGKK